MVLHEVMIFNLMRCASLSQEQGGILDTAKLNWGQFLNTYFAQVCTATASYPHALIQQAVASNLRLADHIFGREAELSCMTFSDSG